MSQDRKFIEYEGVKYCKEEGQWYQMLPHLVNNETINRYKEHVPQPKLYDFELDEHRFCDFGMCFIRIFCRKMSEDRRIIEYEGLKYYKEEGQWYQLQMYPIEANNEGTKNRYKEHNKPPKLYDFKSEELRLWDFGMSEQTYKFFKPEPRLYEFELSKQLEKKWKSAIENSIPMFLTSTNEKTVICELERNCKGQRGLTF
uniref:Uncharacterized protein n=1 Tax=Meloidogyne floridensis TaxID=298350 RepID=A0A915NG33_9BILA